MSRITTVTATRGPGPSHSPPDMMYAPGAGVAHGLGLFSIALGLTQLLAPRLLARATGTHSPELMQCCGVREIVSGIAVLGCSRPAFGMWTRVAGDAMDLAVLGSAMIANDCESRASATKAAAVVAGVTALDVVTAMQLTAAQRLEG